MNTVSSSSKWGNSFNENNKLNQSDLNALKEQMMEHIDGHLRRINEKRQRGSVKGSRSDEQDVFDIIERLGKIDEAQKRSMR